MVGYLYVTKRLPAVVKAIQMPEAVLAMDTRPFSVVPNQGPQMPNTTAPGYPKSFVIGLNAQYGNKQIQIDAINQVDCKAQIYVKILQATGSLSLAQMYSDSLCP
jgi:hypothetical protein